MANYVREGYNGNSCAFNANGDKLLIAGGDEEGVVITEINMTRVQEIRKSSYWGNTFRRPHKYENIISNEVNDPFKRKNVLGEKFVRELR